MAPAELMEASKKKPEASKMKDFCTRSCDIVKGIMADILLQFINKVDSSKYPLYLVPTTEPPCRAHCDFYERFTAHTTSEITLASISQLRELLDEAFAYKNPKDRVGKSQVFLDLLSEAESAEKATRDPRDPRYRQDRRYRVSDRGGGGGSLENICQAVDVDSRHRPTPRQYRGPGSSVSARQREGGSLPCNVNSWGTDWSRDPGPVLFQSDGPRKRSSDPMNEAGPSRGGAARHLASASTVSASTSGSSSTSERAITTSQEIPVSTIFFEYIDTGKEVSGAGTRPVKLIRDPSDSLRPNVRHFIEHSTLEPAKPEVNGEASPGQGVYRTSACLEVGDGHGHAHSHESAPCVSSSSELHDSYQTIHSADHLSLTQRSTDSARQAKNQRSLIGVSVGQPEEAAGLSKSQSKKVNKRKQIKNFILTRSNDMPGYRGDDTIDKVLNFIENRGDPKFKKPLQKSKSDKKHTGKQLNKATSLEELSQRSIDDLTQSSESDRRPDPVLVRSESQSNLTIRAIEHQEVSDDGNDSEFQTVRKKHRRKRPSESKRPRHRGDTIGRRSPRRKSASSMPHSERSADSDTDSIQSLPTHRSASYCDCDNNGSSHSNPPVDAHPLTQEDFPSLPPKRELWCDLNYQVASPKAPEKQDVASIEAKLVQPSLQKTEVPLRDSKEPSPAKVIEPNKRNVPHAIEQGTCPTAGVSPIEMASKTEPKLKTRSKSVGPNPRPPVILLDAGRRTLDCSPSGITFGFPINEQLVSSTPENSPSVPDSSERRPSVSIAAATPIEFKMDEINVKSLSTERSSYNQKVPVSQARPVTTAVGWPLPCGPPAPPGPPAGQWPPPWTNQSTRFQQRPARPPHSPRGYHELRNRTPAPSDSDIRLKTLYYSSNRHGNGNYHKSPPLPQSSLPVSSALVQKTVSEKWVSDSAIVETGRPVSSVTISVAISVDPLHNALPVQNRQSHIAVDQPEHQTQNEAGGLISTDQAVPNYEPSVVDPTRQIAMPASQTDKDQQAQLNLQVTESSVESAVSSVAYQMEMSQRYSPSLYSPQSPALSVDASASVGTTTEEQIETAGNEDRVRRVSVQTSTDDLETALATTAFTQPLDDHCDDDEPEAGAVENHKVINDDPELDSRCQDKAIADVSVLIPFPTYPSANYNAVIKHLQFNWTESINDSETEWYQPDKSREIKMEGKSRLVLKRDEPQERTGDQL